MYGGEEIHPVKGDTIMRGFFQSICDTLYAACVAYHATYGRR